MAESLREKLVRVVPLYLSVVTFPIAVWGVERMSGPAFGIGCGVWFFLCDRVTRKR